MVLQVLASSRPLSPDRLGLLLICNAQRGPVSDSPRETKVVFHWRRFSSDLEHPLFPCTTPHETPPVCSLAMWQDAGKTANQLGHSWPQMVRKAYAARSQKEDAERWWALE